MKDYPILHSARMFGSLILTASLMVGCGGSAPKETTYPVSGKVSLDGEPVVAGEILFHPADPALRPDVGQIKDGNFQFQAKPGTARVEILASKATGKMISPPPGEPGEAVPEMKNYIPAAYNVQSKLSANVTDKAADNKYEFQLHKDGS